MRGIPCRRHGGPVPPGGRGHCARHGWRPRGRDSRRRCPQQPTAGAPALGPRPALERAALPEGPGDRQAHRTPQFRGSVDRPGAAGPPDRRRRSLGQGQGAPGRDPVPVCQVSRTQPHRRAQHAASVPRSHQVRGIRRWLFDGRSGSLRLRDGQEQGTCANHARISREEVACRVLVALRHELMDPAIVQGFCDA